MNVVKFSVAAILVFLFLGNATTSFSQGIIGLWEVTGVEMMGKSMTPVAKWTCINEDGTFQSGNGWLQNSQGSWSYDEQEGLFSADDKRAIKDPFGPFSVNFEDGNMVWTRMEEGHEVTVTLKRIEKKPMSTADWLSGLWVLSKALENGKDITQSFDPDNKYYLFIRWDRVYIQRNSIGERKAGYWHINAHKPELTLLPHDGNDSLESWRVSVSKSGLELTGISDTNRATTLTLIRLNHFPK